MSTNYNINRNDLHYDIRLVYELYQDDKVRFLKENIELCKRLDKNPDDDFLVKLLREDIKHLEDDIKILKECGL